MTVALHSTVVGVFYDHAKAEQAVETLVQAGFEKDQIGLAGRQPQVAETAVTSGGTHAEEAGVAGAVTGGVLGGLLGAGAVVAGLIPGVGLAITAGILAAGLFGGLAAGAVTGGLLGVLIGLGIPEEEARFYHAEFEAGRTIVTVKAGPRFDEAVRILKRCGAYGKGSPLI